MRPTFECLLQSAIDQWKRKTQLLLLFRLLRRGLGGNARQILLLYYAPF